ncbi:alpha/beta fold hydrolase [Vibrio sp.]|uniref:alpha/beta fold hydrolase n=1 Tax=Vibrio sp. TaxID=678 RepID=UPI003D0C5258
MHKSHEVSPSYTQESDFTQAINTRIGQFWSERQEGFISAKDKTPLFWCSMTSPRHEKAVVVVNGRIECCWKYQELFYDLFQQGYDVYSFDHRGQGLSGRLIEDQQMGYVEEFDDYIQDMAQQVEHFNLDRYRHRMILAHSMGATIATRYLQTHPQHAFCAAALSAPMFGIHLPWYLRPIAMTIGQVLTGYHGKPVYAPGHRAYYAKPFEQNPLSQSEVRYQWFRDLYQQQPVLQIGGPSTRWVWQSLMAAKLCYLLTRQIKLPLLIMQAGDDQIVSNPAQYRLYKKLVKTNPACQFIRIAGARHELLFEQDVYRNQALDTTLDFYTAQQK